MHFSFPLALLVRTKMRGRARKEVCKTFFFSGGPLEIPTCVHSLLRALGSERLRGIAEHFN